MVFLLALSPILWLIVSLGFLKMQSFKACPIALIISFAVALAWYHMPGMDAATAALEGVALACWPILLVIIAAIFTYNLTLYTKSMDIVKHMLTTVSKDRRVLALLIGWGFGAFMEGMAGFGTAIAIPASMLVALGFDPIKAILVCLVANSVPTTYGSIGIPASTLANLTGLDPVQLSTYNDDILTLTAKHEEKKDEKDDKKKYIRKERSSHTFCRQFTVRNIQKDGI